MGNDQNNTSPLASNLRAIGPWVFALLFIGAYVWFIVFMLDKTQAKNEEWIKLTYIFGSLEAIVFTAVGFIFGREVNRSRAMTAEKDADKAKKDKKKLAKEVIDKLPPPPSSPDAMSGLRTLAEEFITD